MDSFSIRGAWTLGFRIIAARPLWHALILLGLGVAAPLALQYALAGGPLETVNLGRVGPDPYGNPWLVDRPVILAVLLIGYVLQVGSYFASWRLGFGGTLGGAMVYGLLAGLLAVVIVAAARFAGEYASRLVANPESWFLAALFFLLPLLFVAAFFFVTQAVMFAATVVLLLAFAMAYGAINGSIGLAATLVGGDGSIAVLLLVLGGLLFWLAGRLSCATSIMAERRSFNILAAARDSWRLTLDDQAAITRYLFMVGAAMALLVILAGIATGGGTSAIPRGGVGYTFDTATLIPRLLLAIPFAFLTVMVPAGIYRQLVGEETPTEIFD